MRVLTGALIVAAAMISLPGYSVEPAYSGPLGNAEEPALRPYKWLYRGVKSLFYHTGDQFVVGNLHTPALGSVQGLRGLRRGTFELGESVYRGSVFAPVPPADDYKELRAFNTFVERDFLRRNGSDFLFSWYFFPGQKVVDHYPLEGDEKVAIRLREAKEIRLNRTKSWNGRKTIDPNESDVKRSQRNYIGERADYGNQTKSKEYRGNLMKLAR